MTGGTGGSVTLSGGLVTVMPNSTISSNTAIVSYQTVGGVKEVDVNLNGTDHFFGLSQVTEVQFIGTGTSSNETFENNTGLTTVATGGSGNNLFVGGSGTDIFGGGSGSNTFDAGTGDDIMVGGSGTNVFNESATGSGIVIESGSQSTIDDPSGATGSYSVY
jgi:Ca2+-binding RTX toxin-like protein